MKYSIAIPDYIIENDEVIAMFEWLKDYKCEYYDCLLHFENESDVTMFMLRWL